MHSNEWRKSSYSGSANSSCVEVALTEIQTAVRDSKNATGPQLVFSPEAWRSMISSMPPAAT